MAKITVTGYGEVAVPPDEAVVDLTVTARGDSPGQALASVAERARSVVEVMDELGVPPAKRTTSGIWTNEEFDTEVEALRGSYHAGERLTVAVPTDLVGRLLDAAVTRAEAQVEGPRFIVAQDNPARAEALTAAAENARTRGEALAAGLGLRLGAVVEGGEGGGFHPVVRQSIGFGSLDAPPVEASQASVSATVSITFEAEPA
jgi:uncharacterized protein YggE